MCGTLHEGWWQGSIDSSLNCQLKSVLLYVTRYVERPYLYPQISRREVAVSLLKSRCALWRLHMVRLWNFIVNFSLP